MPLNALTLSVSTGYAGYSFRSKVNGLTAGSEVELRRIDGGGVGYANGFVRSESLSTPGERFELVEFLPATGERRTTRLAVSAARYDLDAAIAKAANPGATISPAMIDFPDGSQSWQTQAVRGSVRVFSGGISPAPAPFVPPNNRIALAFDSRGAMSIANSTYDGRGPAGWLRQTMLGAAEVFTTEIFATGGFTTASINSTRLTNAINSGAGAIMYPVSGNDRNSNLTPAQTLANVTAARDAVVAAGRRFIIWLDYIWENYTGANGAVNQRAANALCRALATADNQVVVLDNEAAFDAAADSAGLLQPDGVHLQNSGGLLTGLVARAALAPLYPAVDLHAQPGLIAPYAISNTGGGSLSGGATGIVALGFTVTAPAGITCSIVQRANGDYGQRFVGTLPTPGSITFYRDFTAADPAALGIVSGDVIESMVDYEVAATTGDLRRIFLGTRYNGGTLIPGANDGDCGAIAPGAAGYPASGYHFKGFRNAVAATLRTRRVALPGAPNRIGPLVQIDSRTLPTDAGSGVNSTAAPVPVDVTLFKLEARKIV